MFFTTGGFPFGDADTFQRPRREVNNTRLYEVLGVSKDATLDQIKKSYRKLAMIHHPDKKHQSGDPEFFKEVSRAYEILSDPEKRRLYNEYGEEGLEGQSVSDPTDIFDLFMGGGKSRGPAGKRRGEDIESPLKVTLEQIYNGTTRKMAISKDVICDTCDGHGGPQDALQTCQYCNGTGVRVQIRRFGPMTQQTRSACSTCRQGKMMPAEKQCKKCDGTGSYKEKKVLEVYVEKGAPDGYRISFSGEADHRPDTIPGDVRFILQQQEHPVFKRKNENLFMTKKITLYEALTGYKFLLTHLDQRKLLIQSQPNEITSHGTVKAIKNEGMPVHKNPFEKGHLLIEFHIVMPTQQDLLLNGTALHEALRRIMPIPPPLKIRENDPDIEIHTTTEFSAEDLPNRSQQRSEAYDEDQEEGGPRLQCRQQ